MVCRQLQELWLFLYFAPRYAASYCTSMQHLLTLYDRSHTSGARNKSWLNVQNTLDGRGPRRDIAWSQRTEVCIEWHRCTNARKQFCELGAICRNHECYSVQCSVRALVVTLTSIIACLKTQQHAVGKTSSTYPNVCFPTLMHPKIGLVTTYTGGERVRCDSRCDLLGNMLISEYLNVLKVSKVGEYSVDPPLTYA